MYWINQQIAIAARPRGGLWMKDEFLSWKTQKITTIICLLEESELRELDLLQSQELCAQFQIKYLHFPIKDRNTPESKIKFSKFINNLFQELKEPSAKLLIHCRMGIGRAALVGAALLKNDFKTPSAIWAHLKNVRGMTVPDTKDQIDWFEDYFNRIR